MDQIIFHSTEQGSEEYETPPDLFNKISKFFGPFDLDVASSSENKKCKNFFTKKCNALDQQWIGKVWCNPPYGKQISLWLEKAIKEIEIGNCISATFLIPARTDTKWFHSIIADYATFVFFVKGRVKFIGGKHTSTFPSMVVHFSKDKSKLIYGLW